MAQSLSALQRAKLSGQLAQTVTQLQSESNAIKRIPLAKMAAELIKQLSGDSVQAAEQDNKPIDPTQSETAQAAPQPDDGLSDDPNSPNYRYRDTGYIAGSRKEQAEAMIRRAKADGTQLKVTDLDWEEIERNPRAAKELITKSNLFGKVDWQALQSDGMDPAAGFLIDRLYASIAKEPEGEESQRYRQLYMKGLESIRARLESCRTVDQVLSVLQEIRDELEGTNLNAEQSEAYQQLNEKHTALIDQFRALNAEYVKRERETDKIRRAFNIVSSDVEKRRRKGWKDDPAQIASYETAKTQRDQAVAEFEKWKAENPLSFNDRKAITTKDESGISTQFVDTNPLFIEMRGYEKQMRSIVDEAKRQNVGSDTNMGWLTLGDGFIKNIYWRRNGNAFAGHVTNARNKKINSWDWAEKESTTVKRATKKQVTFQLRVASNFTRKGGKPVTAKSTLDLEKLIGFRAVQSGKWVLDDPDSARFHVEQTAAAMSDLSDMVGIDIGALGLNGRLGMAFGARGRGNAGWGGAAAAHYEPVERVINLTKQSGGGALAHEWVHSMDNLLPELMGVKSSGKGDFITENPGMLPDGPIKNAFIKLIDSMTQGDKRLYQTFKITDKDRQQAKYNIDNPRGEIAKIIKNAANAADAVLAVDAYFDRYRSSRQNDSRRKDWRLVAAAYHDTSGEEVVALQTGAKASSFKFEAHRLDGGGSKQYWSSNKEMFARAFQSYIEDRLAGQERQNDYLSAFADNKYWIDPIFGPMCPYPDGEERQRINAAFDEVFAAIRDAKVFESAANNKELLDSIFGPEQE